MKNAQYANLDAIQAFAVFAESLNFTHAAGELHISQPALHTKIRRLGEALDAALYVRHGRKLSLTAQGEAVAKYGREIAQRTSHFLQTMHGTNTEKIVVAAGAGAYIYLLGEGLRSFISKTSCELTLVTADRERSIAMVREGRADVGVAPMETEPSDLTCHTLADVGQSLVVAAEHPLASRKKLKLQDLANSRLIVPPEGSRHRQVLGRHLQSAGVPWSVAVEASGWELIISLVRTGVGVAVVNDYCHLPDGLRMIPIPELPRLRYHIFSVKSAAASSVRQALTESLVKHAQARKKISQ